MSGNEQNWPRFLERLAHDMREPLRSIHTFSELLADSAQGRLDPECDRFITEIVTGTDRIGTMADSLSQYALALEEPDGAEASLQLAFSAAVAQLDPEIRASGATITGDALPRVGVKLERLIQLFANLIGNSLRFRRETPLAIHVSADFLPPGQWLIRVTDNGLGVPAEERETIFRPFMRAHGRSFPGVGLGLAICRTIVENHGGTIRMEPAQGAGSVFLFTLPAAD
jgi:signal transduction histidine kinase